MTARKKHIVLLVYAMIIASFVTYFPSLLNGIINWKDDELFSQISRAVFGAASGEYTNGIAPLALALLRIQYGIGEEGYFIYHAVNLLLHTANGIVVFLFLIRLKNSLTTSWIISMLFLLYPIQSGSVAWIGQQHVLLSVLCAVVMGYCYVQFRNLNRRSYYVCSVIAALLYLASTGPGMIVVIIPFAVDWLLGRQEFSLRGKVPFFVLWLGALFIEGAQQGMLSYLILVFNESVAMLRYGMIVMLRSIIMPTPSSIITPLNSVMNEFNGLSGLFYPLVTIGLVVTSVTVKKRFPELFFGTLVFVAGSLSLFTGRINGEWAFNDTAFYFSSVGAFIVIAAVIERILRMMNHTAGKIFVYGVTGIVLFVTAYGTFSSMRYWKNSDTFWNSVLIAEPGNIFALNKLALYHHSKFEIPRSLELLTRAVTVAPADVQSRFHRGFVHLEYMDVDLAISDLTWVVEADSTNTLAYFNLGVAHNLYSRYDSAITYFTKAIDRSPDFIVALNSRGNTYAKKGDYVSAFSDYQRALMINPRFPDIYGNRGLVHLQAGNAQKALADFTIQSTLSPRSFIVRANIGLTAILTGDTIRAISNILDAMSIDSVNSRLYLGSISGTFLRTKVDHEIGTRIFQRFGILEIK